MILDSILRKTVLSTITLLFISSSLLAQNDLSGFYDETDVFFKTYVKHNRVDYQAVKNKPEALERLLKIAENAQVDLSQPDQYKAFWINAYNLSVIKGIVDEYPVSSPNDINGFFEGSNYTIAGENLSLNQIENKKLRAEFDDPRMHFVLVCGAVSCPPIINSAYRPELLDVQLEMQTTLAINDPNFIRLNTLEKTVTISQIFKWYEEDFTKDGETVRGFINQFRNSNIPDDYKLAYYTYDWTLNDTEGTGAGIISTSGQPEKQLSNIQAFTPSKLLKPGQWDLKVFNNFYSETKSTFIEVGTEMPRQNFFTSTFEVSYGVSKNRRVNVGLIGTLKSTTRSNDSVSKGFFSPIEFASQTGISRSGVGSIGANIRFVPFKSVSNFSIQTSFFVPLVENESEDGVFLDRKSYLWDLRFFFDKTIFNEDWQIFSEVDFQYYFGEEGEGFSNNSMGIPISLFLSYFPADWFTVYVQGQQYFLADLGNNFSQEFTQVGVGTKYQLNKVLNLELSYTNFTRGTDTGLGETINLGLRALF